MGGSRLQELNHRGSLPRRGPGHIFFMKANLLHAKSKLGYV